MASAACGMALARGSLVGFLVMKMSRVNSDRTHILDLPSPRTMPAQEEECRPSQHRCHKLPPITT